MRHTLETSLCIVAVMLPTGCGGAPPEDDGHSQLSFVVGDATAVTPRDLSGLLPGIARVVVAIGEVNVHSTTSGWVTVNHEPFMVDLLAPKDVAATLGPVDLRAGNVTQVRLVTRDGGYVLTTDSIAHPLVVPSGAETGIKIVGPWPLRACEAVAMTIAVDTVDQVRAHLTRHESGYTLTPTFHVAAVVRDAIPRCARPDDDGRELEGEQEAP